MFDFNQKIDNFSSKKLPRSGCVPFIFIFDTIWTHFKIDDFTGYKRENFELIYLDQSIAMKAYF